MTVKPALASARAVTVDPPIARALAPVREALLAGARADAERTVARADAAAERSLAEARAAAARIREQARAQGAASGTAAARERQRASRRAGRTRVLRAQRDEYERLRHAARQAVARLASEPDYPRLRQRMVGAVTRALGPQATVRDGPGGGVVGEVPGRRVDYSLTGFADRAVDVEMLGP